MSKKRLIDWHTWAIAGSAIIAMSLFFYLLKPLYQLSSEKSSISPSPIIQSAYYDENCFVIILFSDGTYDRIPTDFKVSDPTILCAQVKQVIISADKKYAIFEGSDWHSIYSTGYYPGNYLGIYFSSLKKFAIWRFGSANVSKATIDHTNKLTFQAVYEEETSLQSIELSLPFIEKHFEQSVHQNTREIKSIDRVIER